MKKTLLLACVWGILFLPLQGHHYKGLPHYGYFENYPQVPTLEFLRETPLSEMFVTIYNFQGLNLEKVDAPDDVRFYVFLYDLVSDKIFTGNVDFTIFSHGHKIYHSGPMEPEQEAIYVLSRKISEQDDLLLTAEMVNGAGDPITIEMPIRITASFADKHGVWLTVVLFFAVVITLKSILNYRSRSAGGEA